MTVLPGVRLLQAYGMTELSPTATILTCADHDNADLLRSTGRAGPYAEVKVVDADDVEVPYGTVGEIVARRPHVVFGRLLESPGGDRRRAARRVDAHTGDGGRMNEAGYVFVVDRLKDMIVSGSENIYSAEIENAVAQHAVIVAHGGVSVTVADLRGHCVTLIGRYQAPRTADVVDALPLAPAAKLDKRELRKRYREGTERGVG